MEAHLKILVLLKYSLDTGEIKVDSVTHELSLTGVPEKIGNIDKNVVEAAVRLKESVGEGTVQALMLGPVTAKEGFKDVLAMGVDEVFLLEDPFMGQADAGMVVRVLESAIRKLAPFDLVMCGFASDDGYTYQVGPRLAERLGLHLISFVDLISLDDGKLRAECNLDEYLETVTTPLPVLLSIAEEAFPPRRITLMDAIKAKKKPVNIWSVAGDLGLNPDELAAASPIQAAEQVGVNVQRKQKVWKNESATALADRIIDALLAENVLTEGA
jgi:electron transfer flavoprotein beta subunit